MSLMKPEIEHAVGLVQHQHLDRAQVEHVLLEVVDDATGRADQDVDAVLDGLALAVVAGAAVDHANLEAGVRGQHAGILVDLDGQFAGRRQHQRARLVRLVVTARPAPGRAGAGWPAERPRSCRCRSAPGRPHRAIERERQGFGLDRGAVLEAGVAHAVPGWPRRRENCRIVSWSGVFRSWRASIPEFPSLRALKGLKLGGLIGSNGAGSAKPLTTAGNGARSGTLLR